jgi:hypothetical protein
MSPRVKEGPAGGVYCNPIGAARRSKPGGRKRRATGRSWRTLLASQKVAMGFTGGPIPPRIGSVDCKFLGQVAVICQFPGCGRIWSFKPLTVVGTWNFLLIAYWADLGEVNGVFGCHQGSDVSSSGALPRGRRRRPGCWCLLLLLVVILIVTYKYFVMAPVVLAYLLHSLLNP